MFDKYSKEDLNLLKELYPNNYEEQIEKLKNNYPIQYLIGYVNFFGYKINVNENVLIPRFETEYLVDDTIKLIKKNNLNSKIIDICTGSGCIAIALAKELNISVDALDISKKAIEVAKNNAKENNVDITFIKEDIRNYISNKKYNVLISNPPYVKYDEVVDLETKYEPQNAIFANDNGLEYYKIILDKSKQLLEDKNIIAFEIGDNQSNDIISIAKNYYSNSKIILKKDLNNKERYLYIINE